MEFKIGDKVKHVDGMMFTVAAYGPADDMYTVEDSDGCHWYSYSWNLSPVTNEPISKDCTCGAHKTTQPSHSSWCDSLNVVA